MHLHLDVGLVYFWVFGAGFTIFLVRDAWRTNGGEDDALDNKTERAIGNSPYPIIVRAAGQLLGCDLVSLRPNTKPARTAVVAPL